MQSTGWRVAERLVVFAMACAGAAHFPVRAGSPTGSGVGVDKAAAERGRVALTLKGFLKPEWSGRAYENVAKLWEQPAPDPDHDAKGYAAAFRNRYGLHPAPFPNDGLPMGLRRGIGPGGVKTACKSIAWSAMAGRSAVRAMWALVTASST